MKRFQDIVRIVLFGLATVASSNWIPSQQPSAVGPVPGLRFIDSSFENASPVWYEATEEGRVAVHLLYDHERDSTNRAAGHIHIRLEGDSGAEIPLEFRNLDNIYNGRPGSVAKEMHRVVLSKDGKNWRSVETEVLENRVRLQVKLDGQSLWLARVEPYRLSDLDRMVDSIRTDSRVAMEKIGQTVEGRPLEMIRIGDPKARQHVFLRARAHPWEAGGNWIVQGLVRELLDQHSSAILERTCFWILPMANKDGVAHGRTRFNLRGKDLNRDWDQPSKQEVAPENHALEKWLEAHLASGKRIQFALELHNDGNGKLHLNAPNQESERYFSRLQIFEDLLRKHTWFSVGNTRTLHGSGTLPNGWQNRYGVDGAVHEFNCQWIERLEKGPMGKDWEEYGVGLAKVLDDYLTAIGNG